MKVIYEGACLDSKIYRILFELVKKEGVESFSKFISELNGIDDECLKGNAVIYGKHPLLSTIRNYKSIVTYLREHKQELDGLDFSDETLRCSIRELENNPNLLDSYLANAKKLESMQVSYVYENFGYLFRCFDSHFERDKNGKMTVMRRLYTDGQINYFSDGQYADVSFYVGSRLDESVPVTFLLVVDNEGLTQTRRIIIKDFAFDASKLPTEEELQSYELPASLKLHLGK